MTQQDRAANSKAADWMEARVTVPAACVELAEEILSGAGAVAVTVTSADDRPNFDPGTVWGSSAVTALFAGDAVPPDLERRVTAGLGTAVPLEWLPLERRDWAHAWKERFGAFAIGERLWVRPSWVEAPVPPRRVELVLDPGMAFGTGQHETTRLCLHWLDSRIDPVAAPVVLDYGCGSGILAIAAAKLGASRVVAVDNDPQALEATRGNAETNGVADRITVQGTDAELDGPFPLVVANILSRTLIELSGALTAATAPGGEIALSGILAPQAELVRQSFPGLRWTEAAQEGDWVRLDGAR